MDCNISGCNWYGTYCDDCTLMTGRKCVDCGAITEPHHRTSEHDLCNCPVTSAEIERAMEESSTDWRTSVISPDVSISGHNLPDPDTPTGKAFANMVNATSEAMKRGELGY